MTKQPNRAHSSSGKQGQRVITHQRSARPTRRRAKHSARKGIRRHIHPIKPGKSSGRAPAGSPTNVRHRDTSEQRDRGRHTPSGVRMHTIPLARSKRSRNNPLQPGRQALRRESLALPRTPIADQQLKGGAPEGAGTVQVEGQSPHRTHQHNSSRPTTSGGGKEWRTTGTIRTKGPDFPTNAGFGLRTT